MATTNKISTRQKEALAALFTSRSIEEAARSSRVGVRTLHRWLAEDKGFQEALHQVEDDLLRTACRRFLGMLERSTDCILEILDDPDASESVRLRAAQAVLDNFILFSERIELEQRISQLEYIADGIKKE